MVDGKHAYVLVRDWLGEPKPVDRDEALAEFARRYLAGHGPASDRDLARWAGLPLRDARAGLSAIASELEDSGDGLVDLRGRPEPAELPPPRLLGPFDPLLLGWTSREYVLGEHQELVTVDGHLPPVRAGQAAARRRAGAAARRGGAGALRPPRQGRRGRARGGGGGCRAVLGAPMT